MNKLPKDLKTGQTGQWNNWCFTAGDQREKVININGSVCHVVNLDQHVTVASEHV